VEDQDILTKRMFSKMNQTHEVNMALDANEKAVMKKAPSTDPVINREAVEMFESTTIKYGTVTITISDTEDGILDGLTSEEAVLLCSDILRQFSGEGSLEEQIDVPLALEETLKANYGWSDVEYAAFVRAWRRNLYLLRIGQQNKTQVNLSEFKKLVEFMDKSVDGNDGIGDSSITPAEQMVNNVVADDHIPPEPRQNTK